MTETLFNAASGGVLSRIDSRGKRGGDLYDWSLKPHSPAPGSSLHDDDVEFAAAYPLLLCGTKAVTEQTIYPVMTAVENLHTAGVLIRRRRSHRQPHLSEVLGLCREAMECAAASIWMLSGEDRAERLDRCLRIELEQLRKQRSFLQLSAKAETAADSRYSPEHRRMNKAHRERFNATLSRSESAYPAKRPPQFSQLVEYSASWIDDHVPLHDDGEIANNSMEHSSTLFYSYGSSFIHGYKWLSDYSRGGAIWTMLSDALAVSINMTECAACLFESAALAPGTRPDIEHFPKRFTSTVATWSTELFGSPPANP
ncbi:hypothetical protein OVA21_16520 [Dietzia sp. SL131]|uniref:hypothetical protein n=1 Tax=Dietzia sp. SL131 TaxID=2995149 RepID=UPI00227A218D|nr:hypothetical protein [Dietzia sp. SL131]MCY1658778.1 hypothetical protein [Dietzia sp. SL131]